MAVMGGRMPLATQFRSRFDTTGKDGEMLNLMVEPDQATGSLHVSLRPGLSFMEDSNTYASYDSSTNPGRGIFVVGEVGGDGSADGPLYKTDYLLHMGTDDNLFVRDTNTLALTGLSTVSAVTWATDNTNTVLHVHGNGGGGAADNKSEMYYMPNSTPGSFANVSDADCPTNASGTAVPGIVLLDGYVVLAKNTGTIHTSDLNAPATWTATNYTSATMGDGALLRIAKHVNHIAVFSDYSIEFFYNAGYSNGSPLARREDAFRNVGLVYPLCVAEHQEDVYFIAHDREGRVYPARLRGFQIQDLTENAPHIAQLVTEGLDTDSSQMSYPAAVVPVGLMGSVVYTVPCGSAGTVRTLVYDIATGLWSRWTFGNDAHARIWGSARVTTATIAGAADYDAEEKACLVMTDYGIMGLSRAVYRDELTNASYSTLTAHTILPQHVGEAGQSHIRKFATDLSLVGDLDSSDSVTVYFSDDDYATWVTAGTLTRDNGYALRGLGSYYRRAYKIEHTGNKAFRAMALDLGTNVGRR